MLDVIRAKAKMLEKRQKRIIASYFQKETRSVSGRTDQLWRLSRMWNESETEKKRSPSRSS